MHVGTRVLRRAVRLGALASVALLLLAAPAGAAVNVSFDASAGELPEGLVINRHGDLIVSLAPRGEIRKIERDGSQATIANLSPPGKGFGPLGLALDRHGRLFAAVATFDPATGGVYRVRRHGESERIPGTEQIGLPNGLAFGPHRALFVTDSANGAIWRIAPADDGHATSAPGREDHEADHGLTVTRWFQDPRLAGDGSLGLGTPLGANGIAYRKGSLFVTVTETGLVVRIPVKDSGRPGTLEVVADGPEFIGSDGCQFDVRGNLVIAVNPQNRLIRLGRDGTITTLATASDGLDAPASPYFDTRDRDDLFVTNFAFGHADPADAHPGVLSFDVGIRGGVQTP